MSWLRRLWNTVAARARRARHRSRDGVSSRRTHRRSARAGPRLTKKRRDERGCSSATSRCRPIARAIWTCRCGLTRCCATRSTRSPRCAHARIHDRRRAHARARYRRQRRGVFGRQHGAAAAAAVSRRRSPDAHPPGAGAFGRGQHRAGAARRLASAERHLRGHHRLLHGRRLRNVRRVSGEGATRVCRRRDSSTCGACRRRAAAASRRSSTPRPGRVRC